MTTVAYQFGPDSEPIYALEGSNAIAGAVVKWLKDNLQVIESHEDTEKICKELTDENKVVFVPAFSGLYAPYWRKDARRY